MLTSLRNTNVQLTNFPQGGIIEEGSSYPCIKRSSFGQNGVAGRVGYKFVDGKKVRYNKNQAKCLINHEGKESIMANRFKEKYLNEVVPALTERIQLLISDGCS